MRSNLLEELKIPFRYPKIKDDHDETYKRSQDSSAAKRKPPKAKNVAGTMKRIWMYLSHSKGKLSIVMLMVVINSGLALLGTVLIGAAVDELSLRNGNLIYILGGLAFVYLAYPLSGWLQNIWMIGIAQKTVFRMRTELFRHLQKLPILFFDQRRHGELMSRVTNDIENVSSTLNSSFIQIVSSLLTLIGTLSVMVWYSPLLTLITLMVIPLMVLGMKWITNRTGRLFKEQQRSLGDMNGYIEETMSGQRIVKTFSLEQRVIQEFRMKNERLRNTSFWAQTFSGFIPKVMNGLNNLSFAVIAGIGGVMALNGMISIGVIVIFAELSRQFTRPINDLANQYNTFLSAVAGAERVFEILDEDEESKDELDANAVDLPEIKGDVVFSHVYFAYEPESNQGSSEAGDLGSGGGGNSGSSKDSRGGISRATDTLSDLSLSVSAGETIAFVGPTGAGKTTILNLLTRFYDADSGQILIDGREITTIRRESLRRRMAFVLQDSFLFQGTIRDNIRYGKLDATHEEIVEAAKQANAYSFIMKLPEQFDTVLQHEGSGISHGQKQLLSIARAIIANPSILILDEATSSIDTITEIHIQEALQRLMQGRTSFVIAHRLNTIQNVDQILVLNCGSIIEKGSHQQLLEARGFYYDLFHGQLKLNGAVI